MKISAGNIQPSEITHDCLITGRNEVVAKAMFLQVSVILSTGVCLRRTPPDQADPPPDQGEPPRDQGEPPRTKETPHPPRTKETPPDQADPPPEGRLQHTVNERPVRILLECNLVYPMKFMEWSWYPYFGDEGRFVKVFMRLNMTGSNLFNDILIIFRILRSTSPAESPTGRQQTR